MWEALLKLGGSCGVQEMGCGVWGTGCDQLTAIGHAKVTAVGLRTYYKLTGGAVEAFHLYQGHSKKEERLGCMGSFSKAG